MDDIERFRRAITTGDRRQADRIEAALRERLALGRDAIDQIAELSIESDAERAIERTTNGEQPIERRAGIVNGDQVDPGFLVCRGCGEGYGNFHRIGCDQVAR